uniref:unspecific monooxygenase n=1 Tax=Varanus komodoensis TaxID=61221 RepID=A0A8D2LH08_VARKO
MEPLGMLTLFLVFFISCLIFLASWTSRHRNLPPGPFSLPIIGNALQLGVNNLSQFLHVLYNLLPSFMAFIPGPHHRVKKNNDALREFVLEKIEGHRTTLGPTTPRDFIDGFHTKMDQEMHSSASGFTTDNLVISILDLCEAGIETISATLKDGLLILLKYPEIQGKVREEIDQVIGQTRRPCMADHGQMPYTNAVLHEMQRFISVIPLNAPHAVFANSLLYLLKGTTVYPVLNSVLRDCKEFPNPEEFDPHQFLHEDGTLRKSDFFMPFSAGKRICLGESLARMELFLFLTTILQNFTLKPLDDPEFIDIKPQLSSFINLPCSYKLCSPMLKRLTQDYLQQSHGLAEMPSWIA